MHGVTPPEGQAVLGPAATGFRVVHTLIAVLDVIGLGYVWACALMRRRDRLLRLSVAALLVEGVALVVGRGSALLARCNGSWAIPFRSSSS